MDKRAPLVYRIRQAADAIGVSRSTIYRMVEAGDIECIPLSAHTVGVPADSLTRWLERKRAAAAAQS